jgi:hypothetical protein
MGTSQMILFAVKRKDIPDQLVIVLAHSREFAKRKSQTFLGGNPDNYIVEPLCSRATRIHFDLTL